jgi:hypothetical protein
MATESPTKFIKQSSGVLTEEHAVLTTAGAADAQRVPALNAGGILDPTLLNAKNTSIGASDAAKVPILDASGRLDASFLPVGVGSDTSVVVASEALAAGDLVNVWNDAGTGKVRKADASAPGKPAHGFVLLAVAAAGNATVYFEGPNTALTGLTPGQQWLSPTTPGRTSGTSPILAGQVSQLVGFATAPTNMNFQSGAPITLA